MNGISEEGYLRDAKASGHRPAIKIGLLWHSVNSDNLGVGALTVSHIALIEKVASSLCVDVRFLVISSVDDRKSYVRGANVETFGVDGRSLIRRNGGLRDAIKRCDLVLDIGGGDGFSDLFSVKRFLYQFLSKWMVVASGRPLILSPQTIGPFRHWWATALARRIMRRCKMVVARDRLSFQLLQGMGLQFNIMEATDVAMALPYEAPPILTAKKVRVGVNVSGLLFNGGHEIRSRFGLQVDYATLIDQILSYFCAMEECEVHLVGHVLATGSPLEDDAKAMRRLADRYPKVRVAPEFGSPGEAKTYIAGMDFFLGARMHACIAAFSAGVPVVPMAYTRKFAGLFNSLDYPLVADCTTDCPDKIMAQIRDGFARKDELRALVQEGQRKAHRKLAAYSQVLADEISQLPAVVQGK